MGQQAPRIIHRSAKYNLNGVFSYITGYEIGITNINF